MRKRKQRRQKAVLPLKIMVTVAGKTLLGHTVDISASGARLVLSDQITPGATLTVEFRHRRTSATVVWCRPRGKSKYDHEIGIHLQKPGASFWGINLPLQEAENPKDIGAIPYSAIVNAEARQPEIDDGLRTPTT